MNLRPTPACRAMPAMVGCRPAWSWASVTASTRRRLRSLSARRARRIGSVFSVVVIACPLVTLDVGEEPGRWLADHAPEPDRYGGVELCPDAPEHGDGVLDLGAFVLGKVRDEFLAAPDDPPERGDLLGGGDRGVAGPFFELGHGRPEAFLVGEQAGEMAAKLGEEAGVAAEVGAAEALMAERAGLAVRLDVGRLGADAEGDGDLADRVTGRLGVQEALDHRAGAFGVAVHLQGGERVDGLALPLAGDAEVRLGGGQAGVAHELGQHLDRCAGVGMTLGEAVA